MTNTTAAPTGIKNYLVTIDHDDLDGTLEIELIGSSPEAAVNRALISAVHMYRHPALRTAATTVTEVAWRNR